MFNYDGVNRLTSAVSTGNYSETGITYDRNGNILSLQRTAGSTALVDDLIYGYTGNRLTAIDEGVRTAPTGDIFAPGSTNTMFYDYDANGNMTSDTRKNLQFSYNFLNLLNEVKSGSTVKAKYTWLADGSKLRVRNNSTAGFDYLGSLTYTSSSSGLALETAQFAGGVIRSGYSQEINYFITDHLGSVRSIVNASGAVVEQNDYYAFGAKHVRSDYPQNSNRFDYNEKEEQTTGDLKYLDYGFRMYDNTIGRWFNVDPLAEKYYSFSPFHYALNNPALFIDPNGASSTHYVDEDYNIILQTNDGLDNVVVVPDGWMDIMRYYADNYSAWAWQLDDPIWNMELLTGDFAGGNFRLADRQFSEGDILEMNMQSSIWSRNAKAAALLKPTFENVAMHLLKEVISQYGDPYKVSLGAYVGVMGLNSLSRAGTITQSSQVVGRQINGFTPHGLDQVITRGFTPKGIMQIMRYGEEIQALGRYGPQMRYTLGGNTIVVNAQGKVVTVFGPYPGNFVPLK